MRYTGGEGAHGGHPVAGRAFDTPAAFDAERDPTLFDLKETQVWSGNGSFQRLGDLTSIRFVRSLDSIERIDGKPDLNEARRLQVIESLHAMSCAIDNDRVIVARPEASGLYGDEAVVIGSRLLQDTASGGGGVLSRVSR